MESKKLIYSKIENSGFYNVSIIYMNKTYRVAKKLTFTDVRWTQKYMERFGTKQTLADLNECYQFVEC